MTTPPSPATPLLLLTLAVAWTQPAHACFTDGGIVYAELRN